MSSSYTYRSQKSKKDIQVVSLSLCFWDLRMQKLLVVCQRNRPQVTTKNVFLGKPYFLHYKIKKIYISVLLGERFYSACTILRNEQQELVVAIAGTVAAA
jgi:hypothetical protein